MAGTFSCLGILPPAVTPQSSSQPGGHGNTSQLKPGPVCLSSAHNPSGSPHALEMQSSPLPVATPLSRPAAAVLCSRRPHCSPSDRAGQQCAVPLASPSVFGGGFLYLEHSCAPEPSLPFAPPTPPSGLSFNATPSRNLPAQLSTPLQTQV